MVVISVLTSAFLLLANFLELRGVPGKAAKLLVLFPAITLVASLQSTLLRALSVCTSEAQVALRAAFHTVDTLSVVLVLSLCLLQISVYFARKNGKLSTHY